MAVAVRIRLVPLYFINMDVFETIASEFRQVAYPGQGKTKDVHIDGMRVYKIYDEPAIYIHLNDQILTVFRKGIYKPRQLLSGEISGTTAKWDGPCIIQKIDISEPGSLTPDRMLEILEKAKTAEWTDMEFLHQL